MQVLFWEINTSTKPVLFSFSKVWRPHPAQATNMKLNGVNHKNLKHKNTHQENTVILNMFFLHIADEYKKEE